MVCEVCCCKHATWTCQLYVLPAAVSNLQWRAAKAIRRQRHAALLGKARPRLGAPESWVWTSWATDPQLDIGSGAHRALPCLAALWPCAGPWWTPTSRCSLALCRPCSGFWIWPCAGRSRCFALLIWPWAGHAAYRSWAGLDSLHCCSRPCAGLLLFYLDKLWCGGNCVLDWPSGALPGLHPLHCLRQCRLELDRRVPPEATTTPQRTPTSRCSAVHPPTTKNGERGSPSTWWRWGLPNVSLKDSWASLEASLAQHGSFLRTSP